MILYFSIVKVGSLYNVIFLLISSCQIRGTVVRPKILTEMKLTVTTKVVIFLLKVIDLANIHDALIVIYPVSYWLYAIPMPASCNVNNYRWISRQTAILLTM